jgi:hypothetical protein
MNTLTNSITKRLDEVFPLMKSTSTELQDNFKNIPTITDKNTQIQIGMKYDLLKTYVSSFFLLVDILEKDLETPLSSYSKEMGDFRDKMIEIQKVAKSSDSLESFLDKIKTNG